MSREEMLMLMLIADADVQGGDVDQAGGEGEEVEGEPQLCRQEGWRPH